MIIFSFILSHCVLKHLMFLFVRFILNKVNREMSVDYSIIVGGSAG